MGSETLYALCVETRTALILGGGGITGGMYELGALSAIDDFIVSGRKSGDFDLYVGISAGSILAAFLANGITVSEMCSAVLGEKDQGLLLRREDIYELPLGNLFRFLGRSFLNLGTVIRHIRKSGQAVTFLNILAVLQQFLPAGFFSNANLERYVARALSGEGRTNDFREVRKPLAIVATEVDTAERWIFGEGGRKDIPISKAIQASTAIPVFFEPVRIGGRHFVDGAAERVGHLDIPAAAGADLIVMINPIVPIYNDRAAVCIPTIDGQCASLTERGVTAIAEQAFRINSRVKLELGALLFVADHPETDLLMIEPSPAESSLFLYGSMNFAERVHSLNYGYNSSVYYFVENFDRLRNDVPPKDRDAAMVFQSYALYPHMTIRENLEFGLKIRKTPKAEPVRGAARAGQLDLPPAGRAGHSDVHRLQGVHPGVPGRDPGPREAVRVDAGVHRLHVVRRRVPRGGLPHRDAPGKDGLVALPHPAGRPRHDLPVLGRGPRHRLLARRRSPRPAHRSVPSGGNPPSPVVA